MGTPRGTRTLRLQRLMGTARLTTPEGRRHRGWVTEEKAEHVFKTFVFGNNFTCKSCKNKGALGGWWVPPLHGVTPGWTVGTLLFMVSLLEPRGPCPLNSGVHFGYTSELVVLLTYNYYSFSPFAANSSVWGIVLNHMIPCSPLEFPPVWYPWMALPRPMFMRLHVNWKGGAGVESITRRRLQPERSIRGKKCQGG